MARELTAYGFAVTQLIIPAGYSNALFVTPVNGQISSTLKWFSGSSLEIMGAGAVTLGGGITTPPVQTAAGQGYMLSVSEAVNTDGAVRFYLCATGATAVAHFLIGLSQGY
jgi:hypothetical protein